MGHKGEVVWNNGNKSETENQYDLVEFKKKIRGWHMKNEKTMCLKLAVRFGIHS